MVQGGLRSVSENGALGRQTSLYRRGLLPVQHPRNRLVLAFNDPAPAREHGISEVFDESPSEYVAITDHEEVCLAFKAMSLGWSWALYFCHSSTEAAVGESVGPDRAVKEGAPSPPV